MRRERQSQSILKIVKEEVSEEQEILYCEKTLLNKNITRAIVDVRRLSIATANVEQRLSIKRLLLQRLHMRGVRQWRRGQR